MKILCLLCLGSIILMKMSFRACHASRLQSCWRGTRKDSTLCFLLALLSFGCLHISSALLRVWQWYLSGAGALLVHTQCTLRYEGGSEARDSLRDCVGLYQPEPLWAQTQKCCWQTIFINCFVECQLHFTACCHMPVLTLVAELAGAVWHACL